MYPHNPDMDDQRIDGGTSFFLTKWAENQMTEHWNYGSAEDNETDYFKNAFYMIRH